MSDGIKQSQFTLEAEQNQEHKILLHQEPEDYPKIKTIFGKLDLENQKFNLIIQEFFQQALSSQTFPGESFPTLPESGSEKMSPSLSLSVNLIEQARLELQVLEQLILEIKQRLKANIDGSISATVEEKARAVKTNALIAFAALSFGLFFSTLVSRQITDSVKKVTQQALKLISAIANPETDGNSFTPRVNFYLYHKGNFAIRLSL